MTNDSILFLYFNEIHRIDAQTINEFIFSFGEYSEYNIIYKNVFEGFYEELSSLQHKIIVLHYSIFGTENYVLSPYYLKFLKDTKSHKLAIFQDEGWYFKTRLDFVNEYNIDSILTCFEESEYEKTYFKYTNVKNLMTLIPGYVSDSLIKKSKEFIKDNDNRKIDISYRSRELPYFVGEAGREKVKIGQYFNKKLKKNNGFIVDIKTDNSDRLYGDDWYRFLGDSKAVLGIESGYSIVDIDNSVSSKYFEEIKKNSDLTYDEFCVLANKDIKINSDIFYRTISPRHFEAAAFKCVQILFEGKYSGILEPWKHYIPLKKDFSNFDEVINALKNRELVSDICENAYNDLIKNSQYSYEVFIKRFDKFIENLNIGIKIKKKQFSDINYLSSKNIENENRLYHLKKKYDKVDIYFNKIRDKEVILITNSIDMAQNTTYIKEEQLKGVLIGCLNNIAVELLSFNIIPDFIFIHVADIRPALILNRIKNIKRLYKKTVLLFSEITNIEAVELLSNLQQYIVYNEQLKCNDLITNIPNSFISLFVNAKIKIRRTM